MGNKRISDLTAVTSLLGTETVPIVQSGVTKKATGTQIQQASPFVNGTDIYATLTAAIAALPAEGGRIHIPAGNYTCSATVEIRKCLLLEGDGGGEDPGRFGVFNTSITWPADTRAFTLYRDDVADATHRCDGTILRNLTLIGSGSGGAADCIFMAGHCEINNVGIYSFARDGIHIEAGVPNGNANGWYVTHCKIQSVGRHGMYVFGSDSNAGLGQIVDLVSCGAWGIYDASFLGNTYIGCEADSCGSGPYKADNANARNLFLGCYSESGQPASAIEPPATIIGGSHAAGFTGNTAFRIYDERMRFYTIDGSNTIATFVYGDNQNVDNAVAVYGNWTSSFPVGIGVPDPVHGTIDFRRAYSSVVASITAGGGSSPYQDLASAAIAAAKWIFQDSFYLPNGIGQYYQPFSTTNLSMPGAIKSYSGSAGIGYDTGAGGTITQTSSRTTGVTLNKICGAITLVSAAGSTTFQTLTVTNSTVAATDTVVACQKSGTDLYEIHVTAVAAGSFNISFRTTGGTTTEQPVFNFAVVKAVTS